MLSKLLFLFVIFSINTFIPDLQKTLKSAEFIISILPIGEIPDRDIVIVKDSLQDFCNCDVRVLERISDPKPLLTYENGINPFKPKTTEFMSTFAKSEGEKVMGITDISFQNVPNNSDGNTIRGFTRGNAAIISNAQIIRDASKYDMSYDHLLVKVAKHELVHLLGIGHCSDSLCIMTSSFPSPDNFIRSKSFCDSCSARIRAILE